MNYMLQRNLQYIWILWLLRMMMSSKYCPTHQEDRPQVTRSLHRSSQLFHIVILRPMISWAPHGMNLARASPIGVLITEGSGCEDE
jgi:hypothetical protein